MSATPDRDIVERLADAFGRVLARHQDSEGCAAILDALAGVAREIGIYGSDYARLVSEVRDAANRYSQEGSE